MKKFFGFIAVLLVFASVSLFAEETIIKWTWEMNDPDVVAFRYQVNGQADEGWKVVGTNETSYSLRNVTPGDTYTLYLQQSYDRLRWSESSQASIVVPASASASTESQPADEPPVVLDVKEEVQAEATAPEVVETPVVE